jgi:nitrite reductase/ring-hydroxylating ferredoxin subunit
MWHEIARTGEIAAGGMRSAQVASCEVCLCEYEGRYYAVGRRCGHQNAPLDQGALLGWIITCPLHYAQFDIRTGRCLSVPINHYLGTEPLPESMERVCRLEKRLDREITTRDLDTYAVRVRGDAIEVDLPEAGFVSTDNT